nr:sensor histidine kinase [Hufsiella ginkgonis]
MITYNKEKRRAEELERIRLNNIINQQRTEHELSKAQNAFLKAQINPHFLFNTLDFVYHKVNTLSLAASDAIITLAEMMRYAIDSDKKGDFVVLSEEIEQVENLLHLYQLRKNNELAIRFEHTPEVGGLEIIPLVLLTLVENIFKHGDLNSPGHEALIEVYRDDNYLHLNTSNLIGHKHNPDIPHTGLDNIERRLGYTYGDLKRFSYGAGDDNYFTVSVSIPLLPLTALPASAAVLKGIDR